MQNTLERLTSEFRSDFFTTDPAELQAYGKDWAKGTTADPLVICFPKTTEEVSKLLKICTELGHPVVPSGGRTGLAGGAVAAKKEIVLSLSKMNQIGEVDASARTLHVQAGAITEAVHLKCKPLGLTWPVDFASKGSSTVGGNISTNAGGVNVIRYGLTRNWVLGLRVVLMSGEVLELNGALEKNNTGIDLRQLFIGSEGILGVITEATLKLSPLPGESDVFLFSVESLDTVLEVFKNARNSGLVLNAFEFFTDKCLLRVSKHLGLRSPFTQGSSHYVLVDLEKPANSARLENWLGEVLSLPGVLDGALAQSSEDARKFWMLREGISESLSSTGTPHKNDIALPVSELAGFCSELEAFFSKNYPGFEICNFGHIGDGNLHINIMKSDALSASDFKSKTSKVDEALFTLVKKYKGSISAEHGIGILKKNFLSFSRTPFEIGFFKTLKTALDPQGLLNPGKVIQ